MYVSYITPWGGEGRGGDRDELLGGGGGCTDGSPQHSP